VNHREIPAGLVVDEVIGFRRFLDSEFKSDGPQTAVRCDRYIEGSYQRGQENWPVFGLYNLVESSTFLQAGAE
jgi:twitching motility protein PilI